VPTGATAKGQDNQSNSEKDFLNRHPLVRKISWAFITDIKSGGTNEVGSVGDAIMQIHMKNGNWDMYNLGREEDVQKFKKNYGELPPVAPAAPRPNNSLKEVTVVGYGSPRPNNSLKEVTVEGYGSNPRPNNSLKEVTVVGYNSPRRLTIDGKTTIITGTQLDSVNILMIIDGKETDNKDLKDLDPNTIESINILKGESAISIYGQKGVNGVLIIKTKMKSGRLITNLQVEAADSLTYNTVDGNFKLTGKAKVTDVANNVTFTADTISIRSAHAVNDKQ
jgi:TonB-dependent SusC/RagA subfamily outer membrane receptor